MITGFLTGSRIYGKPRDDSDIDLCVLVTRDELDLLRKCCDVSGRSQDNIEQQAEDDKRRNYPPNGRVLRFGKLNLLCFVHNNDEDEFFSFALGTVKMLAGEMKGSENRDTAVATIQALMNMTTQSPATAEVSL